MSSGSVLHCKKKWMTHNFNSDSIARKKICDSGSWGEDISSKIHLIFFMPCNYSENIKSLKTFNTGV